MEFLLKSQVKFIHIILVLSLFALLIAACGGDNISDCEEDFRVASEGSDSQDTVSDLDSAIQSCETVGQWTLASEKYPAALDGADPIIYLANRCAFGDSLGNTPICIELPQSEDCDSQCQLIIE